MDTNNANFRYSSVSSDSNVDFIYHPFIFFVIGYKYCIMRSAFISVD